MGRVELPFHHEANELVLRCIKANQEGKTNYLVKVPSTRWQRFWGKHVIGEIVGFNIAGEWVTVSIDLTHPERFNTAAQFRLELKDDSITVTQRSRVEVKVVTPVM